MVPDPVSGWRWPGSFVRFDPDSSSWKTRQCSFLVVSDEFSETWPRWGLMRDGECSEQSTPVRPTSESGSGWWPTPTKHDHKSEWSSRDVLTKLVGSSKDRDGGKLNPTWVEWLMGWPIEWTDLRPLATDRFRQWCASHGGPLLISDERTSQLGLFGAVGS